MQIRFIKKKVIKSNKCSLFSYLLCVPYKSPKDKVLSLIVVDFTLFVKEIPRENNPWRKKIIFFFVVSIYPCSYIVFLFLVSKYSSASHRGRVSLVWSFHRFCHRSCDKSK